MPRPDDLVAVSPDGLRCAAADVHIDPWRPVPRAIITHAHADHAVAGCGAYLATPATADVLRARLGADLPVQTLDYDERIRLGAVDCSLHPAGHLLGSAQVRLAGPGGTWVVSGDYKTGPDPTCAPITPVRCDVFITESTFALPIYRWAPAAAIAAEIAGWWRDNAAKGRTSVLFAYALGKAQRVLSLLDAQQGPILAHGSVARLLPVYARHGVALPAVLRTGDEDAGAVRGRGLVIAPPSAGGSTWMRRFGALSTAFASGWMQVRGARRRRNLDRGFALSDHADWDGLLSAIRASGAGRVLVTHGSSEPLARWLREHGWDAETLATAWEDDEDAATVDAAEDAA